MKNTMAQSWFCTVGPTNLHNGDAKNESNPQFGGVNRHWDQ